jgi:hypothetical protein
MSAPGPFCCGLAPTNLTAIAVSLLAKKLPLFLFRHDQTLLFRMQQQSPSVLIHEELDGLVLKLKKWG